MESLLLCPPTYADGLLRLFYANDFCLIQDVLRNGDA